MKQSKVGPPNKSEEEEEQTRDPIYQQFIALQQDWDTYKNLIPRRQYSTASNPINGNFLQLMNKKSPREVLMSSPQNKRSSPPEGYFWKARNNELAFEIVRERWAGIESGELKGRRLFGDLKEEREEIRSSDWVEELSEVSCMGSHYCEDEDEIKGNIYCGIKEEVAPLIGDEKVEREKKDDNRPGRWMHGNGMAIFSIIVLVLVLFGVISIRSNGGYANEENEVILVPT